MKRQEKETVADTEDVKSASIFLKAVNSIKENRVSVVSFDECKFNDSMVDDLLQAIPHNSVVKELSFDKCDIKKDNLSALLLGLGDKSNSLELRKISLKNNYAISDIVPDFCSFVEKSPSLKEIDVSDCFINGTHACDMMDAIAASNIEKIDFRKNPATSLTVDAYSQVIAKRKVHLYEVKFEHDMFLKESDLDKINSVMKIKQSYVNARKGMESGKNANIPHILANRTR